MTAETEIESELQVQGFYQDCCWAQVGTSYGEDEQSAAEQELLAYQQAIPDREFRLVKVMTTRLTIPL